MTILIAPFSNSVMRDWPVASFCALVELLLEELDDAETIHVIGTPSQASRANAIVRPYPATRVLNDCGKEPWAAVATKLGTASCVIGNNSGVAHVAARLGTPTVCIFGGSHHRREWRPVGDNVAIVSRTPWCSPCHLDHRDTCRYDMACLRGIGAPEVITAVRLVMKRLARDVTSVPAGEGGDGNEYSGRAESPARSGSVDWRAGV